MNAQSLLDQLLKTGMAAVNDAQGAVRGAAASGHLDKYAKGAAAGGLLTLLLGTRSGRRMGGRALKLGSMAALGMLAWKTYNDWKAQQGGVGAAAAQPGAAPATPPALPAPQADAHARALLKAMIAAARSDGHMDERERELVQAELARSDADPGVRSWFEAELQRPVEPAEVAAAATTPERAAEIYLASLMVVDQTTTMERAYLDALARELRLDDGLKTQLENRALAG